MNIGPRPITVLVVDDNPVVRMGVKAILGQMSGIHVIGEAWDGEQAVDLARRLQPQVTLLDVRMPRRDGVSAATEIRKVLASSLRRALISTLGSSRERSSQRTCPSRPRVEPTRAFGFRVGLQRFGGLAAAAGGLVTVGVADGRAQMLTNDLTHGYIDENKGTS